MSEPLLLAARDRVLVFAPHPDDESIACGGLLLAARDAGAARRVVTITDGDNNPWPQRWIEKRWRIDAAARARWGARRRAESQNALGLLGVGANERAFLGFPDTSLTSLLMRDAQQLVAPLREQIVQFQPTLVAFPMLADRHPDHSAVHIAVRLALLGSGLRPKQLGYLVHGDGGASSSWIVELDEAQREAKRCAIASHHTQMTLSGKRFLAFATPGEAYADVVDSPRGGHPLTVSLRDRVLELRLRGQHLHGNRNVLVLLGDASGDTLAWRIVAPEHARGGAIRDACDSRDGRIAAAARWHDENGTLAVALRLPDIVTAVGFVKLARSHPGLVVFDRFGWQAVGLPESS